MSEQQANTTKRRMTFVLPEVVDRRLSAVAEHTRRPVWAVMYSACYAACAEPPPRPVMFAFPLEGTREAVLLVDVATKEMLVKAALLRFYKRYDFMVEYGLTQVRPTFLRILAAYPGHRSPEKCDGRELAEILNTAYRRWVEVSPPCSPLAVRPLVSPSPRRRGGSS